MSRVDEIRERLEAATPGPWEQKQAAIAGPITPKGRYSTLAVCMAPQQVDRAVMLANAEFIAAAPEDISYLLGRVEKLEGLLTRLIEGQGNPDAFETERIASRIATEARTLLADESKENEQ